MCSLPPCVHQPCIALLSLSLPVPVLPVLRVLLVVGEFRPLDMELTLEENGVKDLTEEFAALSIDPDEYIPVVHVYFNDDLTSA